MRERIRHYHIDFFDYVACQRREKYIYEAETYFWQELLEKCEERYSSSTDKTRICKKFSDAYRERLAYQTSNFSSFRVPTLTPGLPDLGPTPTAPQIDDRELKEELGKKYPLL